MSRKLAFLIVIALSNCLWADSSALINEALDKQVDLQLTDTPLPTALDTIKQKVGVPIESSSLVYDLLPWGEQTNISAKIQNQTLRGALEAITRKLGLTFVVGAETVELRPMPALKRLGRRASVQELAVLDFLASTPLGLDTDRPTVKQLLAAVDSKLLSEKSLFAVEDRAFDARTGETPITVPRNATMMDALESIPKSTNSTWHPWGKTLVIVAKEEQIRTQLDKTLTVRYDGVDIAQVLSELSTRAGVDFQIDAGSTQRIRPQFRNVRLILENVSVRQALENISGVTGLAYGVTDKGVHIWNATAGTREPLITLPDDKGVKVSVYESSLPPDVLEYVRSKNQKGVEKIRQMMKDEGFVPTTQSTTKPTTSPTTNPKADDL